jgi:hypothetical protein
MKILAIAVLLAALPLFAGTAVIPKPVHACNIINPPAPCANLPGSNSVNGLGTRFQNQFQGIPGVNPFRLPGSSLPGTGDDSFFVDDRWQLNDRWSFKTPSAPAEDGLGSSGNAGAGSLSPHEKNLRARAQLDLIERTFNRDYRETFEEDLFDDLDDLITELIKNDFDPSGKTEPVEGVGAVAPLLRDADRGTVDEQNDSVMDELENFFVKM